MLTTDEPMYVGRVVSVTIPGGMTSPVRDPHPGHVFRAAGVRGADGVGVGTFVVLSRRRDDVAVTYQLRLTDHRRV